MKGGGLGKIPAHHQHQADAVRSHIASRAIRSLSDAISTSDPHTSGELTRELTGTWLAMFTGGRFPKIPKADCRFDQRKALHHNAHDHDIAAEYSTAKGRLGSGSCAPNSEHEHESRKRKKRGAGGGELVPVPFGEG